MSSPEGKAAVSDGWKKSGIYDAITTESEAEESKWDVEDDWERKFEGDSENNSDNGGSNDHNDFDYVTRIALDAFEDM